MFSRDYYGTLLPWDTTLQFDVYFIRKSGKKSKTWGAKIQTRKTGGSPGLMSRGCYSGNGTTSFYVMTEWHCNTSHVCAPSIWIRINISAGREPHCMCANVLLCCLERSKCYHISFIWRLHSSCHELLKQMWNYLTKKAKKLWMWALHLCADTFGTQRCLQSIICAMGA